MLRTRSGKGGAADCLAELALPFACLNDNGVGGVLGNVLKRKRAVDRGVGINDHIGAGRRLVRVGEALHATGRRRNRCS